MEAFVVVLLAVAVLGVGVLALAVLRRMNRSVEAADAAEASEERAA